MTIVMALPEESQGLFEKSGYSICYTGVGMLSATRVLTEWIIQKKPSFVLNLGTAGSRKFRKGELVECLSFEHRGRHFRGLAPLLKADPQTGLPGGQCGSADFLSLGAEAEKYDLLDMEAYALASVCRHYQIPFLSVKFVSDNSDSQVRAEWKESLKTAAQALFEFAQQHDQKSRRS